MLKTNAIKLVAKSALINDEGKILVLTRSATDPRRPGGLDFPGGEIEAGEDILEGVCREIQEEVGITLRQEDLHLIYTNAADKDDKGKVVLRFLCVARVNDPKVQLSFEHSGYAWMTLEEVVEKFETVSWAQGLRFALKNKIFTNHLQ